MQKDSFPLAHANYSSDSPPRSLKSVSDSYNVLFEAAIIPLTMIPQWNDYFGQWANYSDLRIPQPDKTKAEENVIMFEDILSDTRTGKFKILHLSSTARNVLFRDEDAPNNRIARFPNRNTESSKTYSRARCSVLVRVGWRGSSMVGPLFYTFTKPSPSPKWLIRERSGVRKHLRFYHWGGNTLLITTWFQ